jgi:hypothetical protein
MAPPASYSLSLLIPLRVITIQIFMADVEYRVTNSITINIEERGIANMHNTSLFKKYHCLLFDTINFSDLGKLLQYKGWSESHLQFS